MAEIRILDDLEGTIAMVTFLSTALLAITEQRGRVMDESEIMGMHHIFSHVEERMERIKSDVKTALFSRVPNQGTREGIVNFGETPPTFGEAFGNRIPGQEAESLA
jgi:hypothetical protein